MSIGFAQRTAVLISEGEFDPRLLGLGAMVGLIWLGLDVATSGLFLTPRNLYNLAVQSSVVGVMACGMVLVITARHIDLSVGSVLGVTGMTIAVLQAEWLPTAVAAVWPVSVLAGMLLGGAIGAWQGWWIAYRGVPAFVVTLAGLLVFRGAAYMLTDGRTVTPLADGFEVLGGGLGGAIGATWGWLLASAVIAFTALRTLLSRADRRRHGISPRPRWADGLRVILGAIAVLTFVAVANAYVRPQTEVARGVPIPVLLWAGAAAASTLLLRATRFGRYVYAIGGNPEAAKLAGIDVRRVTLGVFVAMGVLAAVAGVITTARLGAGTSSLGTLAELSVIAAAVIGGTSLAGGHGSIAGAILGALIMQSLESGMVLLGVTSPVRQIVIGLVLIVAVWIDAAVRRRGVSR